MKIEDFESRFNNIIQNPDTGLADAPEFLSEVRGDYESANALADKVKELETRVKDLQESNIKLYLAQTGSAPEETDAVDENDGDEYVNSVFENLVKESED